MGQLYLQLLGDFEACDAQGLPVSFPTRKAQGLVAYLALPPGRFHSREKLAGLLWGRSADEQARSSLRQTLSTLRRTLAEHDADVVVSRGESLALDASGVDSDVGRFEAAGAEASASDAARASELYSGDLLEGFSLHEEARRRTTLNTIGHQCQEHDRRLSIRGRTSKCPSRLTRAGLEPVLYGDVNGRLFDNDNREAPTNGPVR